MTAQNTTQKMNFNKEDNKLKFKQKLDYLKATVDYAYLVQSLGFEIDRDGTKELRGPCIIHGGDNRTAFRFNKERGTWVCFTNKCNEVHGGDVIGLIQSVRRIGFMDAVEYLEDLVGDTGDYTENYTKYKMNKQTDELLKLYRHTEEIPAMVNDKSLAQFKSFRSKRFLKDGFKKETLDYFDIAGGYTDSHSVVRDIIPIRNVFDELVAYSLRDIRDNADTDFKYLLTPGFDKDHVLYNLNKAKDYCSDKPLIVVEGFKSVWKLYEYGIKNVVAVMGSGVTRGQQMLLSSYAANGVVLLLDGDLAGIKGTTKAYQGLKGNVFPLTPIFILDVDADGNSLDPADLSKDVIYNYLEGLY